MKSKFTPKVLFLTLALTVMSICSYSQATRGFFLNKVDNTLSDTVSINLYVKNFTMVEDFQFSIDWDTTVLNYIGYSLPITPLGITATSGFFNASKKGVGILWYDATLMGTTVPDSTIIFIVKLAFKNGYSKGVIAPVVFGKVPTAFGSVDTTDGNFSTPGAVPDTLVNGYISTPFLPTIAHGSNGLLVANTPSTVPPASYQWYILTGIGGPGSTYTYTAIPGATSSSIVGASGVRYNVVAIYANGDRDTSANSVLPLKLSNFNGKNKDRANLLSWTATNEFNVASYLVERSVDGANFTDIGSVKSSVNSQDYSFTDGNLTASFSYYYRLKMVDAAGGFSYSSVVKLNKQGKLVFQIQPNPVENSTINLYGNNMKQVNVYDVNGKLMLNTLVTNPDQASIKMNNLTKGVYMINVISTEGVSQTEKFIVK